MSSPLNSPLWRLFIYLFIAASLWGSQPGASVPSWFTLQSLLNSFAQTGAPFDGGRVAVVLGWLYLLIIISATASLIAVKKGGRPSRRQGQLMMTCDDLQLLTSCHSCSNVRNLLDRHAVYKLSLSMKCIYLHIPLYFLSLPSSR